MSDNKTPKTVLAIAGLAVETVLALVIFGVAYDSLVVMDYKNAPTAETYVKIGLLGVLLALALTLVVRVLSPLLSGFDRDHKLRRASLFVLVVSQAAVLVAFAGIVVTTLAYLVLELTGPGAIKAYLDTRVETDAVNEAALLLAVGFLAILATRTAFRAVYTYFIVRSREKETDEMFKDIAARKLVPPVPYSAEDYGAHAVGSVRRDKTAIKRIGDSRSETSTDD